MKTDLFHFASLWCSLLVIAMVLPSPAMACAVPVFKYALAYWSADPYEVIVFHRGTLSSEEQAIADRLQKVSWDSDLPANVTFKAVDLAKSPGAVMKELWEDQPGSEPPWMVVKYPRMSMIPDTVWSGPFKAANVEALLDSPVRKENTRRILKGEVAVWIL